MCGVGAQGFQENNVVGSLTEAFKGDLVADTCNNDASIASFLGLFHGHDVPGLQSEFVHAVPPYFQEVVGLRTELFAERVEVVQASRFRVIPGNLGVACGHFREVFEIEDGRAFAQELNTALHGRDDAEPALFRQGVEETVDAALVLDAEGSGELGAGRGDAFLLDVVTNGIERLALPVGESDSFHGCRLCLTNVERSIE